jgi:hypothetical protein
MVDNATPSRFGSINAGQDGTFANDYALFLKVWSGEILTTFVEHNKVMPLHVVRTIPSGKTAQFPVTGTATAAYHAAGALLLGTNGIKSNEKTINIDNPLIADTFIANIDDVISHFDVKSEYTRLLSRALAKKADQQLLQVACLAARAAATITGGNGGSALVDAAIENDGDAIFNALFDAQQAMDEKDVPEEDRFAAFKPAQYKLLARSTKVHNSDWGGTGDIKDGKVLRLAGFNILKTNNLPTSNVSADSPAPNNTYHANFANTMGVCWQREAMGTVKLRDLVMESEYQVSRQGTLMVAKMIVGHGILRPECAVELKKA